MAEYNLTGVAGRVFKSKEYGNRLVFVDGPTNPRDELGKNGVNFHNWFTALFRRTVNIKIKLKELDKNGNEKEVTRTLRLNRNSFMQYLDSLPGLKGQVRNAIRTSFEKDKMKVAIDTFNAYLKDKTNAEKFFEKGVHLRHAGTHNKKPILNWRNAFGDLVRGKFFGWLYQVTISTMARLRVRFLFANKEREYFDVSETLAKRSFNVAAEKVPAYQEHLKANATFQGNLKKTFGDIPATSKKDYITKNKDNDEDLHLNGLYPEKQKVDTSTGTTGTPTVWVRGEKEVETVKKSLQVAVEIESGNRKLHYIDAFALGPWATGMTAYELMRATGSVFASGTDNEKIIQELDRVYKSEQRVIAKEVSKFVDSRIAVSAAVPAKVVEAKALICRFINEVLNAALDDKDIDIAQTVKDLLLSDAYKNEKALKFSDPSDLINMIIRLDKFKSQLVVAGYPPYLKDLVDKANRDGKNFKKYHARAIVGGQAISEALREKLIETGFSRVNSSYGASDLDINLAVEAKDEIDLRKILEARPEIARELYGDHKSVPMVFHYDPFNYHIETDADNELIFTCNRTDRSSPRVRYDLGDQGRVFAVSDVQAILAKHGIIHNPKVNLPLVFVWGRDSAVPYHGCKVDFTDLERAITNLDTHNHHVKRAFYSYQDADGDEQFVIWTELADGVPMPTKAESEQFLRRLLIEMAMQNQDFLSHIGQDDNAKLPILRIHARGKSPISDVNGARKQVLVFKDSILTNEQKAVRSDDINVIEVSITKDAAFIAARNAAIAKGNKAVVPPVAATSASVGHRPGTPRLYELPSTSTNSTATNSNTLRRSSSH